MIDATTVARDNGMSGRINTIMQTCYFALSGVLPREDAIKQIKKAIEKTYFKKGQKVIDQNFKSSGCNPANLYEVDYPKTVSAARHDLLIVSDKAPDFVKNITSVMMADHGINCLRC